MCFVFGSSFGIFAQKSAKLDSLLKIEAYYDAFQEVNTQLTLYPRSKYFKFKKGHILRKLNRRAEALDLLKELANNKYPRAFVELSYLFYDSYELDRAKANMRVYLKKSSYSKADSIAEDFYAQCKIAHRYLKYVKDVVVVDTAYVKRSELLDMIELSQELGHFESLYTFVTGRKDKKIGVDIHQDTLNIQSSYRYLQGWSEPLAIKGSVNSIYNENYPFECADGVTLYFASDRPKGLGGYDIYFSTLDIDSNHYREPKNIGMPFNSPANDYLYIMDELANRAWFVSDRGMQGDSVVIYEFKPDESKQIIQIGDSVSLRHFALMDSIHWMSEDDIVDISVEKEKVVKQSVAFTFIVSDAVVYHYESDFKDKTALNHFEVYQTKLKEHVQLKQNIERSRQSYARTNDARLKKEVAVKLIAMEQKEIALFQEIQALEKEIRRAELAHK